MKLNPVIVNYPMEIDIWLLGVVPTLVTIPFSKTTPAASL